MRHPTEGVLRRLLDEPAAVPDPDRDHVAACDGCLARLASVRHDAALVGSALSTPHRLGGPEAADVGAGWRRLSAGVEAPGASPVPTAPRVARAREALRRPVVAAVAVAAVVSGAGVAAANDWLEVFRTEQVAAVSLSAADLIALPDLEAYGDVELTGEADLHEVADAGTAAAETGLEVPEVDDLPRGVTGEPVYQVGGELGATFTFSADQAAAAARAADGSGDPVPAPQPGLDGSQVRMVAGPGVAQLWRSDAGAPALFVGRAVAPTAYSSGAPFETVRDYLLSLPGLPEDVAAQLRSFGADGSTLPLPVPADEVTSSSVQVDGAAGTLLVTRDRTLAAVVWVDAGLVTAVAGALDADEVLSVAEDLQ